MDYIDSPSPILILDWNFLDFDWTGLDLGFWNLAWQFRDVKLNLEEPVIPP